MTNHNLATEDLILFPLLRMELMEQLNEVFTTVLGIESEYELITEQMEGLEEKGIDDIKNYKKYLTIQTRRDALEVRLVNLSEQLIQLNKRSKSL